MKEKYGPWAVIAGASEGTGSAFAHRAASEGINCILIARRQEPLNALAEQLQARYGVECVAVSVDLSASNAAEKISAVVDSREIGLFISNAGADSTNTLFLETDIDEWVGQINRNVVNVARCCHLFAGPMVERGRGGIILVGSGACYGGAAYMSVYSGTKAFDLCFGEGLWTELQPKGVDVLNLILGQTDTPAFRASLAKSGAPVPDNLASPDDVASVGFERLPHGPIHNWGLDDEDAGYAISSAASRRDRALAITGAMKNLFRKN